MTTITERIKGILEENNFSETSMIKITSQLEPDPTGLHRILIAVGQKVIYSCLSPEYNLSNIPFVRNLKEKRYRNIITTID